MPAEILLSSDRVSLRTPWHPELPAAIKAAKGWWDPDTKSWWWPTTGRYRRIEIPYLAALCARFGVAVILPRETPQRAVTPAAPVTPRALGVGRPAPLPLPVPHALTTHGLPVDTMGEALLRASIPLQERFGRNSVERPFESCL